MKTVTKTITFTWDEFESGDYVTPVSKQSALELGRIYKVTGYTPPQPQAGMLDGLVFVEGHKYGYTTEYLRLVEPIAIDGEEWFICPRCEGETRCYPIDPTDAIEDDGKIPCPECEASGMVPKSEYF